MFELRKIGIVKRLSALLLDVILLAVLTTGFMYVISLICNYDYEQNLGIQYNNEWDDYRKEYAQGVSEAYGFVYKADENDIEYTITDRNGNATTLDAVWTQLKNAEGKSDAAITAEAWAKFQELTPPAKVNAQVKYVYSLLFMMISIGILLAYLVLEFVVPLILKNGQTVGKKIFGICLVRPNCVKITPLALLARTLIGKFAIETMFPVFLLIMFFFGGMGILAIVLLAALLLLDIVLLFATKNRTPIHDIFAYTVAVDAKLQVIFKSEEELIEKKTLQHKEEVESAKN